MIVKINEFECKTGLLAEFSA